MMRRPGPEQPFLLLPGPIEIVEDVAAAALRPMIGHRGPEIRALLKHNLPRVQRLLHTNNPVLPLSCSATGAMEASLRNAAPGPFLHLVCGAFSQRWAEVRKACGYEGDVLEVSWGEPILPTKVKDALQARSYGAVTCVHSETSTGVLNPLREIAEAVRGSPDTLLLVDTVSSMAAVELRLDRWNVDVCFAGTQKAWGLPPGLTLCAVSERAIERSRRAQGRGFYFDWDRHVRSLERWQTPATPPVSLLFQLEAALDRIEREGPEARYDRHRELQDMVLAWAKRPGLRVFAREGYRSPTLTALELRGWDPARIVTGMRRRGWVLAPGYGWTSPHVLRIGHMGELQAPQLGAALEDLDQVLLESEDPPD